MTKPDCQPLVVSISRIGGTGLGTTLLPGKAAQYLVQAPTGYPTSGTLTWEADVPATFHGAGHARIHRSRRGSSSCSTASSARCC